MLFTVPLFFIVSVVVGNDLNVQPHLKTQTDPWTAWPSGAAPVKRLIRSTTVTAGTYNVNPSGGVDVDGISIKYDGVRKEVEEWQGTTLLKYPGPNNYGPQGLSSGISVGSFASSSAGGSASSSAGGSSSSVSSSAGGASSGSFSSVSIGTSSSSQSSSSSVSSITKPPPL